MGGALATAVDLFGGLGGFSEGARQAGVRVLAAANHWPVAVATHAANHPEASHVCQDLHQVDWGIFPRHDALLASPACQPHSRARGLTERPHHDAMRATAWAVVSCLEAHRAELVVVENVPEFRDWELYPVWRLALERLGYRLTEQVLDAAAFGVPQHRERLFVVGHRKRAIPIVAPAGPRATARAIVDWEAGVWSPVDRPGRSPLVLRQWRAGRERHGERFLVGYHSDKRAGVSLDGPVGTITTKDQWAVVDGDRCRMFLVAEYLRAMGFPDGYRVPVRRADAVKAIGNAVPPPLACGVLRQVLAFAG